MPKGKKKKKEEELLGQIFNFIFKEAKKPPEKRKPLKMGGAVGSTELSNALAAVLEKPGLYITDQALEALNEALTIEVGRMKMNEMGSAKVGFTTTNIAEFLSDPNKALDKATTTAKAMRKSSQMAYLGRWLTGLGAVAWAQKYNLDLDTQKAIRGFYEAEKVGKEAVASRALGTAAKSFNPTGKDRQGTKYTPEFKHSVMDFGSEKNHIMDRSSDLIGKELFGRVGWENLTQANKQEFKKRLVKVVDEGDEKKYTSFKTYLTTTFGGNTLVNRFNALGISDGISDSNLYLKLEQRNVDGRIADMQSYLQANQQTLSPNQIANLQNGITRLDQAKVIISGQHLDAWNLVDARNNLSTMLTSSQSQLEVAQRAGDRHKVSLLKNNIRDLKKGKRQLDGFAFWGNVGRVEGVINSWNNIWSTNAVVAVLDGSFYDANRNMIYNPAEEEKVVLGMHKMTYKDENGNTRTVDSVEKVTVFKAAVSKNPLHNTYNNMMTNLYYLTPRSLMRTMFVNGEGFIYLAYLKRQNLIKDVNVLADNLFTNSAAKAAFIKSFGDVDILKLAIDSSYYDSLVALGLNPGKLKDLVGLSKISRLFSAGQRARERAKEWLDEHIFKRIRQKIYNSLISKLKDEGAKALLGQWLAKGGLEVLAKSIVIGILDALGIAASGGAGSFLVPILSALIVDVLYGIAKVLLLFILLITAGMVGLAVLGGSKAVSQFNNMTYAYSNVVPGDVVTNPNFKGTSPIDVPNDPVGDMKNFVGGALPNGEKCLLGSAGSYHCSQGPLDPNGSHSKVVAIDVTGVEYFYAPTFCGDNNCAVTFSAPVTCRYENDAGQIVTGSAGGMVVFTSSYGGNTYKFKLIHVATTYGVGSKLSSGQRVARIMTQEETTDACSSGKHLHLQTEMNGAVVNPSDVLNTSTSSGGFGCHVNTCAKVID